MSIEIFSWETVSYLHISADAAHVNTYLIFFSVSLPRGDIVKKVGSEPFPIYCHLNPNFAFYKDGLRADSLGFYAQQALIGSDHQVYSSI